jgi:hypothetical protein
VLDRPHQRPRVRGHGRRLRAAQVPDPVKERLLAVTFEHGPAVFLKGWLKWGDGDLQRA